MPLMGLIRPSQSKVMFFSRGRYKVYDTFYFSICTFVPVCFTISWYMKVIKEKKFVMVVFWWRVKEVSDCVVKKVSWWFDIDGG